MPSFDHKNFLEGAKYAFESIINAYNKNDKQTLKDRAKKELIELKEYLDIGIITQEEFDKKAVFLKKILLGN